MIGKLSRLNIQCYSKKLSQNLAAGWLRTLVCQMFTYLLVKPGKLNWRNTVELHSR